MQSRHESEDKGPGGSRPASSQRTAVDSTHRGVVGWAGVVESLPGMMVARVPARMGDTPQSATSSSTVVLGGR